MRAPRLTSLTGPVAGTGEAPARLRPAAPGSVTFGVAAPHPVTASPARRDVSTLSDAPPSASAPPAIPTPAAATAAVPVSAAPPRTALPMTAGPVTPVPPMAQASKGRAPDLDRPAVMGLAATLRIAENTRPPMMPATAPTRHPPASIPAEEPPAQARPQPLPRPGTSIERQGITPATGSTRMNRDQAVVTSRVVMTGFRALSPQAPAPRMKHPPLPADPEQLAATAERLKLRASPALAPALPPSADKTAGQRVTPPRTLDPAASWPKPLPNPDETKQAPPPLHAAKPVLHPAPPPADSARAAGRPPAAARPAALPVRPPQSPPQSLPGPVPKTAPQIRIRIGALNIVTRERTSDAARKSLLPSTTRRPARGHSIPRDEG